MNAKAIGMANASVVGLLLQRKRPGSAAVNAVAQKKRWYATFLTRDATQSAERGIVIVCRLSVRLYVCPTVTSVDCDHISWNSLKIIHI